MKKVNIYTDGSCLGNPGPGGWCAILQFRDIEKVISGYDPASTNNRMEITAVIKALEELKEPCEIELISDSKYVVDGINEWLPNWIKKGFVEVKNPDLWRRYSEYIKPHKIKAYWTKGHANHSENERCDSIARDMAQKASLLEVKEDEGLFN